MPRGYEWLILVAVLLLLFGTNKLPAMARSIGQSARVFKGEMKGLKADDEARAGTGQQPASPPPAQPPAAAPAPATEAERGTTAGPGNHTA